ncbi:MAG: class I SAM-dependent methyltransferase [Chloroflexia bacterium]|nr:class I SAM-dependent methyltransferase [Chloroflexia bacterium]
MTSDIDAEWSPATDLLLTAALADDAAREIRWLLLGCAPALATALAEAAPNAQVRWVAADVREFTALEHAVDARGTQTIELRDDPVQPMSAAESFEVVAIHAPADRALARRWLVTAHLALALGGTLSVVGANAAGIRSVIADATRLFGAPTMVDYRRHHRVARWTRVLDAEENPPDWLAHPGIAPGTWRHMVAAVRGTELRLDSLPGTFAAGRLDTGTALLLEHLAVGHGERVLDVGCGAGVVGLVAARLGAGWIDLVDVDLAAVATARHNLALNEVANGRALPSDTYEAVHGERYDLILSNPPFHRGKRVDHDMPERLIAGAPAMLVPGGRVRIVANAFLRHDALMRRVFARVEVVAATRQYHVLEATRPREK